MKLNKIEIPMRTDEYRLGLYIEKNNEITSLHFNENKIETNDFIAQIEENIDGEIYSVNIKFSVLRDFTCQRLGMRLGIDSYMDTYPAWNDKLFPTALRCEQNGFWGCFMSPVGTMLAVASKSKIVSWCNEYKRYREDVGHRIYTSSVDFINLYPQPERHIKSPKKWEAGKTYEFSIYFGVVENKKELYDFVEKYSDIKICALEKYTVEKNEPVYFENGEKATVDSLDYGRHIICEDAQSSVYVRKDWFFYLDQARKSAEKCQQKPGTHCESWYGFFTMAAYAKLINDTEYTKQLVSRFDAFFNVLTKGVFVKRMKRKALPGRLQNSSAMVSLLTDFYELTNDIKYLNLANDFANWLIHLQWKDGSYRNDEKIHYTCVIYPAKSMLELVIAERKAGLAKRADKHYKSAFAAIDNLYRQLDNIETEGEMTFEDGMISCEALQLAYLALLCDKDDDKKHFTDAAKIILNKHRCLEQNFIPDCRTAGASLRFWEARYDVNFNKNMLNSPHGWTSWKTYATYYLYLLTGEPQYLKDTMNTLGSCMQCIDENGVLNWAFIADPYIAGKQMLPGTEKETLIFKDVVIGESYLPIVSDWYKHPADKLQFQYIQNFEPEYYKKDYGGSCDNNVHEHFKCLDETVFGKSFIHIDNNDKIVLYNCRNENGCYITDDIYVKTFVVFSNEKLSINITGKTHEIKKGFNYINV